MELLSYNHVVTLMLDAHLVTDNAITRMGQSTSSRAVAVLPIFSVNKSFAYIFPEHSKLSESALYGNDNRHVIHYGRMSAFGMFGITIPAEDGVHIFCVTIEYEKMLDPSYQDAVRRSIHRIANASAIRVDPDAIHAVVELMHMQPTPRMVLV